MRMQHTTLLSATLLDCAMHGEVLPQFAAYVVALGTPAQAEAETRPARRRALDRLRAARGRTLGRCRAVRVGRGARMSSERVPARRAAPRGVRRLGDPAPGQPRRAGPRRRARRTGGDGHRAEHRGADRDGLRGPGQRPPPTTWWSRCGWPTRDAGRGARRRRPAPCSTRTGATTDRARWHRRRTTASALRGVPRRPGARLGPGAPARSSRRWTRSTPATT